MKKVTQPQELEVFYIIPALRREITEGLMDDGKGQKEIAKLLQVSEPSVSHYVNSHRASQVKFDDNVKEQIKTVSRELHEHKDVVSSTQKLLRIVRDKRIICKVCHEVNKEQISAGCKVCFE